jgi:peptidoglycan/LPS O-acetylase OafA/YrhL
MAYLSTLDAIRAIAVILVVVSHLLLQLASGVEPAVYSFRTMGRVGVAIFFVHTTLVLMASLERHGTAAIPFYVRRIFRIYPLSIAAVLFFALLQLGSTIPIDAGNLLSNLFLVQNLTGHASLPRPLWSLPYEVQMYLVLPALYQIMRTRRPVLWAGLLFVGSVLMALTLPPASLALKLMLYVPCFLPGVLAFVLFRQVQATASPLLLFGLIVGVGVLAIPMLVAAGVPEMPLLWSLCAAIGLTIPICRQLENKRLALGANLIAKYSYGIYLTHVLSLGAIDGLMPGPAIVQWAAMLILLPGLAYICYHGIEKHGIALGARLAARCATDSKRDALLGTAGSNQTGRL